MKKELKKSTDVETKGKRKDIAAKLGEAVVRREKLAQELNKVSQLCNSLATELEKFNG